MSNVELIRSVLSSKSDAYELLGDWCMYNLVCDDAKPVASLLEAISDEFGVIELGKWFRGDF